MKKAKRIEAVPPYLFAQIDKKKEELSRKGKDIIDLGVGDPDLPTPPSLVKELQAAIADPKYQRYPPYEGTKEFKRAVADWYKKRFKIKLNPDTEVISLIGSKEGIAHIFLAFVDTGDYALIPDPCYPVYKIATLFAGGVPFSLPLQAKNNFLPDLNAIPKAALKKAKLLFINYPNNPTGAVASRQFLEKTVAFAKKNNLLLCSDLAYSEVAFDGYKPMSILEIEGAKDVAIEFHSLSKTYNVTGWRIGMAVGNAEAIAALSIVKTNIDSGAYKAIQHAAANALAGSQEHLKEINEIYSKRRDILVEGFNSLGWKIKKPRATFYIWAPVPKGYTSASFAETLLEKAGVLVVPGSGYGEYGEGYFRAAITVPESRLKEAVQRVKKAKIRYAL